jgi:CelD/BcsL family acetyltransferase involved in cellulose biosynthesis
VSWQFHSALQSFPSFARDWDRINQQQGNHILLDSRFIEPLVRHFGSGKMLLAMRESASEPGMALIEPGRPRFWQTFQPGQAPLGAILLGGNGHDSAQAIRELIRSLPGFALGFSVTQQDPELTCFANLNGSLSVETLDYIQTPRLTVSGNYEDYWKQRSKNLTHNLSRQRRRLKEQGSVIELIADRSAEAVAGAVHEYGLLESSGWKGGEGSAVSADNTQGRFYREMLEDFCTRNEAVLYRLRLNRKTVASDLCLERDGTLVILKTAYDESVQGLSLGLLLHQEIFQSVFDEGKIRVIEFYGQLRDWHTKWTNEFRTMYHVNVYRHQWVPIMRRFLKKYLPQ